MKQTKQMTKQERDKNRVNLYALNTRLLTFVTMGIWIAAYFMDLFDNRANGWIAMLWIVLTPFTLFSSIMSATLEDKKTLPIICVIANAFLSILFLIGLASG